MPDPSAPLGAPSIDWSDADLLWFLAKAWDMPDPNSIRIVGRLRLAASGGFGFLEDLHDATSGRRLPIASPASKVHESIFVAPPDVSAVTARPGRFDFFMADVALAPRKRRIDKGDPLACNVRPQSMTELSRLPDSWKVPLLSIPSEDGPLLLGIARAAIESQLKGEAAIAAEVLQRMREGLEQEQMRREASSREAELELQAHANSIEEARQQVRALREQDITLRAMLELERRDLEKKLRNLDALLHERGERLVALDLVDRDDLAALLPPRDREHGRTGHDFRQVLGGRFDRLAPYIQSRLWTKGILFSQTQLRDFLALLRTHDLIVLAGDSGSGKTSLVRAVAASIGAKCTIIPVKPNWTGPEDLLGYYNPIEKAYRPTPFLQALLAASSEPDVPHFICLDEMNLARVEHYFSDFLSLLEVRDTSPVIPIYTSDEEHHVVVENGLFLTLEAEARKRAHVADGASFSDILTNPDANALLHELGGFKDAESVLVHHARLRRAMTALLRTPRNIRFPDNVRIIGAVNIDETTHYLSPKVLDRAHVLRFRNPVLADWDSIEAEVETFEGDAGMPLRLDASDLGARGEYPAYDRKDSHAIVLTRIARDFLDPLGVEFGLRAIRQSLGYIRAAREAGLDDLTAIDRVVQHKVLPKLMLDVERNSSNGRSRKDLLRQLRDELDAELRNLQPTSGEETSVTVLDRLLGSLDGNHGIANYWLR